MNELDRVRHEGVRISLGYEETMSNVRLRFGHIERPQMEIDRDSLRELPKIRSRQRLPQFGLTHQQHLKDEVLFRIYIGEQPQFLQCIRRQILRLIENQQCAPALRILAHERVNQCFVFLDLGLTG